MVDYTLTPNKSLLKPNRGTYVDTWDVPINSDWDYVDRALGGSYAIGVQAVPANPVILTNDQTRYQQLAISNQTAIITVQIPLIEGSSTVAVGGMWIVDNGSNTFDVYLSTLAPGTNTLTLKAGKRYTVFSNGTSIFFADDSRIEAGSGLKLVGNTISIEGASAILTTARGGTGFSNGYTSGQLLIGKADGTLGRATLTAGTNVTITNGDGTITINSTGGGGGTGGLTSIGLNTTLSGISFDPSIINTTNTSTTLKGTLGISSGGTGTSFAAPNVNPGIVKLSGLNLTSVSTLDLATETTGTLAVGRGGTGITSWSVNVNGVGAVYASSSSTLTSGTLPATAGGTGLTGFGSSNQALFSSSANTLTAGTLPVQAGGTGLNTVDVANKAIYSLGLNVFTAGTLPVAAGGTNKTSWTLNTNNVGAVWADTVGSLTSGTLPVTAGGTGLAGVASSNLALYSTGLNTISAGTLPVQAGGTGLSTVSAANLALYSTALNTITAGTLPTAAGGTGVTTSTGTGNNVLSASPTFTGTANFAGISASGNLALTSSTSTLKINTASALSGAETVSVVAPTSTDGIVSKVSTNSQYTFIGQNSSGSETFYVDGSGNAVFSGGSVANGGVQGGTGTAATGALSRFFNTSDWAAEFKVTGNTAVFIRSDAATAGNAALVGCYGSANAYLGGIVWTASTSTLSLVNSSDYRLKDNVENYENGLEAINKLRPVTFTWKRSESKTRVAGFLAHEVQPHISQAVIGDKDAVDENGEIIAQTMDQTLMIPAMVSAIKELSRQVTALQAEVSALKGR